MLWMLVGIIIGFLWCYYDNCWPDFIDYLFSGFIGFIIGIPITLFVGGLIGFYLPKQTIIEEAKLVSLTDNTSIEGQKYLFSGYINEEYIYRYVIETEEGKQIKELYNSKNIYIKYDNENPRIIYEYSDFKYGWLWLFGIDLTDTKIIIYVPEGTITEKYEIDLGS